MPSEATPIDNNIDILDEEFDDSIDQELVSGHDIPDNITNPQESEDSAKQTNTQVPDLGKTEKTFKEILQLMDDDLAPIIPDAVTDYYLSKSGFETSDVRIKRLLALATQKFISDISQDTYEYSRIRSSSAVYNSSNPQLRAKQLLQGQQYANQQNNGSSNNVDGTNDQPTQVFSTNSNNQQGKIVLTLEDLSNALCEYGINTSRPEFYR
ncbi:hypothetical protein PUMCH_003576 [Australozyma saopauloensis]|uniref:Transcription initiation factor TFIID subunit 10 n=1 Tax=Australozyma saopauloensis TaxID=291208 RepID=A0AAX4HD76_9ASCO|nr:hypothetical protein PUMCH_003576 [[Candida] saopauloensis]